ncbi:MAG: Ger(x)C family spore germination C-terminal domain-containing protein [Christensenellaceae bacterium]|jgi:spore germination protein KC|nr:Ger(x)C family spore germination C-terminal domain-containing protein [Christensenellaceae bacterium]
MNNGKIILRFLLIFITIFISCFAFGCTGGVEPRNIAITNSALYDLDGNGNYHVLLEIIDLTNSGDGRSDEQSNYKRNSIIKRGDGATLAQAITSISDQIDKTLFGTHNRVRIITDRMAKNKQAMQEFVDFMIRNDEFDERPWLFIINHEDIEKLFTVFVGLESLIGEYIDGVVKTRKLNSGCGVFVETLKYIIDSMEIGQDAVAGRISIIQSDDEDQNGRKFEISFDGLSAFKDNKFMNYLTADDALAYNILNNYLKRSRLNLRNSDLKATAELTNVNTKILVKENNGSMRIDINISGKLRIAELEIFNETNISSKKLKVEIENTFEEMVKTMIEKTLFKARDEINSDIIGFGRRMRMLNPAVYDLLFANTDYLSLMVFNSINIDLSIANLGDLDISRY